MTETREPWWLDGRTLRAAHARLLGGYGATGVRDEHLLESALARPRQRWQYVPDAPLVELAAALAFGIAKNHPFHDGNKRAAFIGVALFLERNGLRVVAGEAEVVVAMVALAAGELDEAGFAAWLAANVRPR